MPAPLIEQTPIAEQDLAPLELTRNVRDVSVTERAQFRSCRRRWHLETIENLEPNVPPIAFEFGTVMHQALDVYYTAIAHDDANALSEALSTFTEQWQQRITRAESDKWPAEILDEMVEHQQLGTSMLNNYDRFDSLSNVQLGEILAVEGRLMTDELEPGNQHYPEDAQVLWHPSGRLLVPIVDPTTHEPIQGKPMLSARIDLLTRRATPHEGIWPVDHKAMARATNDRGLDFDDQVTGYCYVVWRWLEVICRGAVYNTLVKQEPKEPRLLKNGTLSTAKDQLTTPAMYSEALKEHGLYKRGKISSPAHADCLNSLLAHGWDRFFQRHEPTRNEAELEAFEQWLVEEYRDMSKARRHKDRLYPNLSSWHCPNCKVNRICRAMNDGSDVDHIIATEYREKEDRKA